MSICSSNRTCISSVIDTEDFVLNSFGADYNQLPFRARQKAVTMAYVNAFLSLPQYQFDQFPLSNEYKTMYASYGMAKDCCQVTREAFIGDQKRYVSSFCKKRFCVVCNRIRQMVNFSLYEPLFRESLYFVTLTRRNVPETALRAEIQALSDLFREINKNYFHRSGDKLKGLRKIETTYNAFRDDYHPHLHFLLTSKDLSIRLVEQWLMHPKNQSLVSELAQDIREADENSVFELCKYTSKIQTGNKSKAYVHPLDVINRAMCGRRSIQPFGFLVSKQDERITEEAIYGKAYEWVDDERNWVHFGFAKFIDRIRVQREEKGYTWFEYPERTRCVVTKEPLLSENISKPLIDFL